MNRLMRLKHWLGEKFPLFAQTGKGQIEGWELFAPQGGQWTTIDGKIYWTIWDYRTKDWDRGDYVTFKFYYNSRSVYPVAVDIKKVHQAEPDLGLAFA